MFHAWITVKEFLRNLRRVVLNFNRRPIMIFSVLITDMKRMMDIGNEDAHIYLRYDSIYNLMLYNKYSIINEHKEKEDTEL
jgi:hypothetical protein